MRFMRTASCLLILVFLAAGRTESRKKPLACGEVILLGKLTQVTGIGGETAGWNLELTSETTLGGQKLTSIEVSGLPERLAKLANQHVKARGFLKHHHGVERKDWLVLELTGIRAVTPKSTTTGDQPKP